MKNSKVVPIVPAEAERLKKALERSLMRAIDASAKRCKGALRQFPDTEQRDALIDSIVHCICYAHHLGFYDALDYESDRWARGLCGKDYKEQFRKAGVKM